MHEAYNNRGNALKDLKRLEEALASYDKAIALKPDLEFLWRFDTYEDEDLRLEQFGRRKSLSSFTKLIVRKKCRNHFQY